MNSALSKRVTFSNHAIVFEYFDETQQKENYSYYYSKDLMDWMRQEPRHISPQLYMTSVQNLLEDVCQRQPVTVVYGNLGRYPKLIQYYIDVIYAADVAITFRIGTSQADSDEENCAVVESSSSNSGCGDGGFDSLIKSYDEKLSCDVLFWIEPRWGVTVERPCWARRLIVLTSHLRLEIPDTTTTTTTTRVVAFRVGEEGTKTPPLKNYVRSSKGFDYSFVPDLFLNRRVEIIGSSGQDDWIYCGDVRKQEQNQKGLYKNACADLTKCNNVWEVYLRLLTARDIVRYSMSNHLLETWSVAIDEDLKKRLLNNLVENKNIISTKYAKIPCNLNGVNTMVEQYVDPFLV